MSCHLHRNGGYLNDTGSIARSKRMGIHKLIPLIDLPDVPRKLMEHGEVSRRESAELLTGLVEDGLINKRDCTYIL